MAGFALAWAASWGGGSNRRLSCSKVSSAPLGLPLPFPRGNERIVTRHEVKRPDVPCRALTPAQGPVLSVPAPGAFDSHWTLLRHFLARCPRPRVRRRQPRWLRRREPPRRPLPATPWGPCWPTPLGCRSRAARPPPPPSPSRWLAG